MFLSISGAGADPELERFHADYRVTYSQAAASVGTVRGHLQPRVPVRLPLPILI
ncbi:hypothetical protein GJ744_009158 [Endocarpon pusillum]|uniref:Uncharacterized protein n=1 Tax=Endocarpon pusillum TaxID=364733 RepID=A0A8H7AJL0_9EURO|nr:hypothetical protein GJ744_009158 [Endocarpon pusillum]